MPTYQYACTQCGEPLEAVQRFSDDPLTECPACGGRLRKVFSAVGVVFRGSGFYRTDSRAAAGKGAGEGAGEGGSGKGAGEGGSGGAKGAASKEPAAASSDGKASPKSGAGASASSA